MQDQTSEGPQKDLKSRIIEALKKIDPEDPKIQEIIKSEVKQFFAENPSALKVTIRGRGEELFEKYMKEKFGVSQKTEVSQDHVNAMNEISAAQRPTPPQGEVECEKFIRNLKISLVSDSEIKFQIPEKRGRTFNRGELGMQKSHKVWKAFLEILQDPDHIYSLGKAAFIRSGKEKTRVKDYDTRRQALLLLNGRLISFFEKNIDYFGVKFPKNFKLYKHKPQDPPRTFRFKFFLVDKDTGTKYSEYSEKEIIAEIKRLLEDERASDKQIMEAYQRAKKLGISDQEISEIIPQKSFPGEVKYVPNESSPHKKNKY